MANASRDENHVTTLIGVDSSDGTTVKLATIAPVTHHFQVEDGTTGSDLGGTDAIRDDNHVPVALAVSSDDGETPVPLYINADGKLLVDSN